MARPRPIRLCGRQIKTERSIDCVAQRRVKRVRARSAVQCVGGERAECEWRQSGRASEFGTPCGGGRGGWSRLGHGSAEMPEAEQGTRARAHGLGQCDSDQGLLSTPRRLGWREAEQARAADKALPRCGASGARQAGVRTTCRRVSEQASGKQHCDSAGESESADRWTRLVLQQHMIIPCHPPNQYILHPALHPQCSPPPPRPGHHPPPNPQPQRAQAPHGD